MKKLLLLTIIIAIVIGVAYYKNVKIVRESMDKIIASSEEKLDDFKSNKANAIREGRKMLDEKLISGFDLEKRPCLAEEIVPNWAIDIVHNPLEDVDSEAENQCQSYLEGRVENIILMDEYGHQIEDGMKFGF
ncbi:hypothetical protein KKA15_00695 [Patescibacteria group bacterium]|nr:hypothetical protein [Patescibacteria group bacterium]